eukprot:10536730-Lingulodinium_polyedra.AAC.1
MGGPSSARPRVPRGYGAPPSLWFSVVASGWCTPGHAKPFASRLGPRPRLPRHPVVQSPRAATPK